MNSKKIKYLLNFIGIKDIDKILKSKAVKYIKLTFCYIACILIGLLISVGLAGSIFAITLVNPFVMLLIILFDILLLIYTYDKEQIDEELYAYKRAHGNIMRV